MKFLSKKAIVIYIVIAAVAGAVYYSSSKDDTQEITTQIAESQTIVQEVIVTGKVKPVEDISLSFDSTGRVARINKKVGDQVSKGQVVASLENGDLAADVAQAQANLRVQEASLLEIEKGTREEEVEITRTDLEKAKQDLSNYFDDISNVISDALLDAEDALNKQTFQMFTNPNSERPEIGFNVTEFQNKIDVEANRVKANDALDEIKSIANNLPLSDTGKEQALIDVKVQLEIINTYLNSLFSALTNASGISETTKDTYKANVTTARTNITSELSSANTILQSIASQRVVVQKTQNQLDLQLAGATSEEVVKAEARVDEARAQVTRAQANLTKTLIVSPITGIVSRIDMEIGETVTAGTEVVDVISGGNFEIEVSIPEVDVAKLEIGNEASLTLDAYGSSEVFLAHVAEIEPAERVIEGVPTYKTTLVFKEQDERVRAGMTANLTIETARKENVLAIPQRAVITRDGKKYTRILSGTGQINEVEISTGLQGTGGLVEVTSGINEGDEVVTFIKED